VRGAGERPPRASVRICEGILLGYLSARRGLPAWAGRAGRFAAMSVYDVEAEERRLTPRASHATRLLALAGMLLLLGAVRIALAPVLPLPGWLQAPIEQLARLFGLVAGS
jgi:hypothetical protein